MTRILSRISIGISFGLVSINSILECLNLSGYVTSLALYTFIPIALAAAIVLSSLGYMLYKRHYGTAALLETVVPALLKLAFLIYPLITNVAFGPHAARARKRLEAPLPLF